MQTLDFWFDPISPYAWLAFDALPDALQGLNVQVNYQPVLFAGLLAHWGQKGPAEIEPKRVWTYRDVLWRAHRQGLHLELPTQHPFNPLPLLRLALACTEPGMTPSRQVVETVFRHVWEGGQDASDTQRLQALRSHLEPTRDPDGSDIKAELRIQGQRAVDQGIFGVPTVVADGHTFWGADALPMLTAWLNQDPWFASPEWAAAQTTRDALRRP